MNFHYNDLLRQYLYSVQETLGLSDYNFVVDSEQSFIKHKDLLPNTIYVLTKELQNEIQIGVTVQPVQILVLTEQNSLDVAKALFTQLAKTYNWNAYSNSSEHLYVKQQYSEPVVLSNFNTIDYGYRSVLYIGVTLYIMENVADISNFEIDDEEITPLNFNMSYSAQMNTQQSFTKTIATSDKSISTLSISFTIPPVSNDLIEKIVNIISQANGYTGNENFNVTFTLNGISFNLNMKVTSFQFSTAPNNVPSYTIGLIL